MITETTQLANIMLEKLKTMYNIQNNRRIYRNTSPSSEHLDSAVKHIL
jgi:hypothetical protein